METKTFAVSGMKCEHCQKSVENALKGLTGVKNADVSLADKNVTVEYDESTVSPAQMKEAVDNIGRFEMTL
ncbi:MAG: heavy-metal-associated domain-containing protein [Prevotella sp.]